MNKLLTDFLKSQGKEVSDKECSSCNKKIVKGEFRDALSAKEFTLSGLCQKCQDGVFGESVDNKFFLSNSKSKRLAGINESKIDSKLFTAQDLKKYPMLDSQHGKMKKDIKIVEKLNGPGRWTFYLMECNGEDKFLAYIKSGESTDQDHLGYITMNELEAIPMIEKTTVKENLTLAEVMSTKDII